MSDQWNNPDLQKRQPNSNVLIKLNSCIVRTVPKKKQTESDKPFEEIVQRLQAVVHELESGELSLEKSLLAFEEGIRLARIGGARLQAAEQRVEKLLKNDDPSKAPKTEAISTEE